MKRIAAAVIAASAAAALAAGPGSARTTTRVDTYNVTQASGFVRITFQGEESAGCAAEHVCGTSGVVTFRYHGRPKRSRLDVVSSNGKVVSVAGRFLTKGEAVAKFEDPDGEGECSSAKRHETLVMEREGSKLHFVWHGDRDNGEGDFLHTVDCPGPDESDLRDRDVLPFADLDPGIFTHHDVSFGSDGNAIFTARGFSAQVDWNLKYSVSRRDCSPDC